MKRGLMLLAFIALAFIYLMLLTTGLWFLAVIVLVVLRGQGLAPGWRWLSGANAVQWLAISVFYFVLWFNYAPLEAYISTALGLGAAASLTIFFITLPFRQLAPA